MLSVSRYPGFLASATSSPRAHRERGTLPAARGERQPEVSAAVADGFAGAGAAWSESRCAGDFAAARRSVSAGACVACGAAEADADLGFAAAVVTAAGFGFA